MDRTELILAKLRERRAKATETAEVSENPSENLEAEPQPVIKPKRTFKRKSKATAVPVESVPVESGAVSEPVQSIESEEPQNSEQNTEDKTEVAQNDNANEKKLIDNIKSILGEDGLSNYLNSRKDLENLCKESNIQLDNLSKQAIITAVNAKGEEFLPQKREFLNKLDSIYDIIDGYFNIVKSELKMPELTEQKLYELVKKASNPEAISNNQAKEEQVIETTDDGDEIPKKGDDPYNGIQEKETLETIQDDFYTQIVSIAASYYIHKKEEENNNSILHAPNLDDERRAVITQELTKNQEDIYASLKSGLEEYNKVALEFKTKAEQSNILNSNIGPVQKPGELIKVFEAIYSIPEYRGMIDNLVSLSKPEKAKPEAFIEEAQQQATSIANEIKSATQDLNEQEIWAEGIRAYANLLVSYQMVIKQADQLSLLNNKADTFFKVLKIASVALSIAGFAMPMLGIAGTTARIVAGSARAIGGVSAAAIGVRRAARAAKAGDTKSAIIYGGLAAVSSYVAYNAVSDTVAAVSTAQLQSHLDKIEYGKPAIAKYESEVKNIQSQIDTKTQMLSDGGTYGPNGEFTPVPDRAALEKDIVGLNKQLASTNATLETAKFATLDPKAFLQAKEDLKTGKIDLAKFEEYKKDQAEIYTVINQETATYAEIGNCSAIEHKFDNLPNPQNMTAADAQNFVQSQKLNPDGSNWYVEAVKASAETGNHDILDKANSVRSVIDTSPIGQQVSTDNVQNYLNATTNGNSYLYSANNILLNGYSEAFLHDVKKTDYYARLMANDGLFKGRPQDADNFIKDIFKATVKTGNKLEGQPVEEIIKKYNVNNSNYFTEVLTNNKDGNLRFGDIWYRTAQGNSVVTGSTDGVNSALDRYNTMLRNDLSNQQFGFHSSNLQSAATPSSSTSITSNFTQQSNTTLTRPEFHSDADARNWAMQRVTNPEATGGGLTYYKPGSKEWLDIHNDLTRRSGVKVSGPTINSNGAVSLPYKKPPGELEVIGNPSYKPKFAFENYDPKVPHGELEVKAKPPVFPNTSLLRK